MWVLLGENRKQFGQQIYQRLRALYDVDWATDVSALRMGFVARSYALLVLGLEVPVESRIELVNEFRRVSGQAGVLMVSDMVPVHERVQAIEAGADDYLTRPIHMDELVVRAKALVRRVSHAGQAQIEAGRLRLDADGDFYVGDRRTDIQFGEGRLLSVMMRRAGRVVTRDMIEHALAGSSDDLSANAIEQRVSRLRRMLARVDAGLQIRTVRGAGYVLEPLPVAGPGSPLV